MRMIDIVIGVIFCLQTITSAMSTLTPPVTLEDPANQSRVEYILEVSSSPDFDYPSVSVSLPSILNIQFLFLIETIFIYFISFIKNHFLFKIRNITQNLLLVLVFKVSEVNFEK